MAGKAECETVRSSTFKNGIIPSIELAKSLTKAYILRDTNVSGDLTYEQVFEFREVSKFLHMATDKLFDYLFVNEGSTQQLNLYLSCFGFGLLTVVNLIILFSMERLIGRSVDSEYVFIRQVYSHFIPSDTVTDEKRLRALFMQAGIINRQAA